MHDVALIIPDSIDSMSMLEASYFYRDQLGWLVHPLQPPNPNTPPKKRSHTEGKKPIHEEYWNLDPHTLDPDEWFNSEHPCNIGISPTNCVFVDLDSKQDHGESVRTFLASHPELASDVRYKTGNGCRLLYRCNDIPQHLKKYKISGQINAAVSVEIFFGLHSNVVLPPSLHYSGIRYAWEIHGEVRATKWNWLTDTFKADIGHHKESGDKKTKWHEQFQGDLATLNLVALLEELNFFAQLENEDEGKYSITCPWQSAHSATNEESKTSCVIWQHHEGQSWPGFDCKHAHCAKRKLRDLLQWVVLAVVGTNLAINAYAGARAGFYTGGKTHTRTRTAYNRKKPAKHCHTTTPLAIDLETYSDPKIGRKGRITTTGDALDPFKGDIRLLSLCNPQGDIQQFDLRQTPVLPPEIPSSPMSP